MEFRPTAPKVCDNPPLPARWFLFASRAERRHGTPMRPVDIQQIGSELAVKWDNGGETFVPLEKLRRACPCANCHGEMDVLGNVYKGPDRPLTALSTQLRSWQFVGGYAIQPVWADCHSSGIYSFDYLQRVAAA